MKKFRLVSSVSWDLLDDKLVEAESLEKAMEIVLEHEGIRVEEVRDAEVI